MPCWNQTDERRCLVLSHSFLGAYPSGHSQSQRKLVKVFDFQDGRIFTAECFLW